MRDYRGVSYDRIEDLKSREAISTIDEFLRQLSFGVANLNKGKRADGSGQPIAPPALDDYFYLPGRNGGQIGHGGNAASNSLTLASTRHTTKGKIYLGTAQQSAYDELNSRFGVNTPTPAAKLHIVTEAATLFGRPVADISVQHARVGGATNSACVNEVTSDGNTSYIVYNIFPNAIWTEVYSGSTFTYTGAASGFALRITLGKFLGDADTRVWQHRVRLETTAGVALTANYDWDSTGVDAYATKEFTLSDPECVAVAAANTGAGYRFVFTATYGGFGTPTSESRMTHLELQVSAATPTPLTYWDSASTRVASVSASGAGQFQNVLLEDPGAGTGTISLIAPTSVTSYSLTFPANDGDNLDLLQTNGSGTLSWVTFASLLDDDLEAIGALTRNRGDLIVGGASAWVDLAIGTAAQLLQVNSGATDPAWVSMSADATLAAGGALTLATVNANVGTFGSATQVGQFTVNAKGLVTAAANITITGVAPAAHTHPFTDITPIATDRLLGRDSAGSGAAEELSVSGGLEFTGSGGLQTSALTGDAAKTAGGTSLTLATVNSNVGTFGSATQSVQVTVNAKGLVTAAANVAITYPGGMTGFAIPTVDVDVLAEDAGTAVTALRSDARLQLSQAITPTWLGLHTHTRGSDATALLINSFSNAGVNPLLSILDTSAVRIFGVDPSGTVSIGNETSAVLDKVRFQVRAPLNQSANIAQILLNGVSRWTIGSTGKMVLTTTAPQFDIDSAATGLIWTATDVDGNGTWATPASARLQAVWIANGPFTVDTSVDGGRMMDSAFTISGVWLYRTTAGAASSTILDLNKNGITMYTTQGNRPTMPFNDADGKIDCTLPDVLTVAVGDVLTVDTDQIETGTPQHWMLVIEGA